MTNKTWSIEFKDDAFKEFSKLDNAIRHRIMHFLEGRLIKSENPKALGEPLKGKLSNFWRFRVGNYRIIAAIEDKKLTIVIIKIAHRREVYH